MRPFLAAEQSKAENDTPSNKCDKAESKTKKIGLNMDAIVTIFSILLQVYGKNKRYAD